MLKWKMLFVLCFLGAAAAFSQGYLCAVGGGSENYRAWSDGPYRWMVEKSGFGPALVLHYDEGSVWLENYFKSFGASSAQSLVVRNAAEANDSSAYKLVRASRMIFLRGGDQSRYYLNWKGTLVEKAIREVWEAGGVVGGTSAGLAVLGEVDYTAETPTSVTSDDAIANPLQRDITLKDDFLPLASGVIFDSHFTARVRLGRLAAFLANWRQSRGSELIGLGVDENTAACFEPDGTFMVQGAGCVTVLHANPQSRFFCQSGKSLSFTDWSFHTLTVGFGYDTRTKTITQAPPEAKAVLPQWQAPQQNHARLLLHGGTVPAEARTSLQKLIAMAGSDSLLILGGSKADQFASYLTASLQFTRFRLVLLDTQQMQSAALAGAISRACAIMTAGLTAAEVATLFAAPSPLSSALQSAAARPEAVLLLAGEALPLCGSLRLVNAEVKGSDLLYGQLAAAPGLSLLPFSSSMYKSFVSDDYRENRLGGLTWLLYRDPAMLGFALDKTTAVAWEGDDLLPQSSQPLLIMDLQNVTYVDSSDYRTRTGNPPRQSAGFYGGLLHCQSEQDSSAFDLRTRVWHKTTGVKIGTAGNTALPGEFSLLVTPNPGKGAIVFRIMPEPAAGPMQLKIYNLRGQAIYSFQTTAVAGKVVWNGRDPLGATLPSGLYLAVLQWGGQRLHQAFTLLR